MKIDRGGSTARAGLPTVSRPWTGPAKGLLRPCALGVFPGSRTDSRDCEGFRGAPDSGRTRPARERRGRGAQTSPYTGHDPPYTRGPRSETGCLWLRTPAPRTARSPGRQGQLLELESRVGCVGSSKNLGRAREGRADLVSHLSARRTLCPNSPQRLEGSRCPHTQSHCTCYVILFADVWMKCRSHLHLFSKYIYFLIYSF